MTEEWKHYINYAIRNIEVGDGEQTRLWEDKWGFMKGFWREGVSLMNLWFLAKQIDNRDYDGILEILLPYKSHAELYENDWDRWEFQTWNDPDEWDTFEEWIES